MHLGVLIPICPKWHSTYQLKSSESLVPSSCVYRNGPAILGPRIPSWTRRNSFRDLYSVRFSRDTWIPPPWLWMTQKCCKIDKSTISYIIWCVSPQRTVRNMLTSRTAHPIPPIYITWFFTFGISACLKLDLRVSLQSSTCYRRRPAQRINSFSIPKIMTCRSPRGLFKSSICKSISAHLNYLRSSVKHHTTIRLKSGLLNFEWDLPLSMPLISFEKLQASCPADRQSIMHSATWEIDYNSSTPFWLY